MLSVIACQRGLASRPNVVFVLCDDLGYGDVHCLNPQHGKIPTPAADRLASQGMIFTDAHSGSSVCTPTRYGLMTGRYSWRTRLQRGVVTGFAPSLIAKERPTVAGFLRQHGYQTAAIGKWHLDFQYLDAKTRTPLKRKQHKVPPVGAIVPDGPIDRGFDIYHGFHHARDMRAIIDQDRVVEHDDVENMLPRLTRAAESFIRQQKDADKPFFLYLPLGSPHTPIVPTGPWKGRSGMGDYGDFVMQTDHALQRVMDALWEIDQTENTLLVFSSDNGCSKAAGIPKLAAKGHRVSAWMRGSKADIWEGGHRVPFIVRWPGHVQAGSQCAQTICLTDLFATLADLLDEPTPVGSCEDSVSFLPALSGNPIHSTRKGIVHHSFSGHFAYRQAQWKLILARGSGGWTSPKENQVSADSAAGQLYDLGTDPGERQSQFDSMQSRVQE
ncbi:MAG: arylsulfatase, partial [Planctomycetota bacterium]